MIVRWVDKEAEKIFAGQRSRRLPAGIQQIARRKLVMLDAATRIDDLRIPPLNRLEKLAGKRAGQWSIRINDQWRICFVWRSGNAADVEIADYHQEDVVKNTLAPIHPGEVLAEEFLGPLEVSQYRLAHEIGVPPRRINEIVLGKRSITADTATRLARFFGTSEMFWMNLQSRFELDRLALSSPDAADTAAVAAVPRTRRTTAARPASRHIPAAVRKAR